MEQKILALQHEKSALASVVVKEDSLANVLDLDSLRQILSWPQLSLVGPLLAAASVTAALSAVVYRSALSLPNDRRLQLSRVPVHRGWRDDKTPAFLFSAESQLHLSRFSRFIAQLNVDLGSGGIG